MQGIWVRVLTLAHKICMTTGKVKRFDFCFFIGETENCQNKLKVLFHLENSTVLWHVTSCHKGFLSIPQMTFFLDLIVLLPILIGCAEVCNCAFYTGSIAPQCYNLNQTFTWFSWIWNIWIDHTLPYRKYSYLLQNTNIPCGTNHFSDCNLLCALLYL